MASRDSFSLWTWARVQTARSTAYFNGCPYVLLIYYYITINVCVSHLYNISALVGSWSSVSIRRIIYKFLNVCPFDYTAFAVSGKVERSETGLTTPVGWLLLRPLTVPKSVSNRCVIEVLVALFVLSRCFLDFSVGVGAFVIGLSQISTFFLKNCIWCSKSLMEQILLSEKRYQAFAQGRNNYNKISQGVSFVLRWCIGVDTTVKEPLLYVYRK